MSSTAFKDTFGASGELAIYLMFPQEKPLLFFSEDNLIVNNAKKLFIRNIYLANQISDPIIALHVGTGGCLDAEGLYVKTEDPTAIGLNTPLITTPTSYDNTTDPTGLSITFLADISQSQGNGNLISEAALFKVSGNIFNLKYHPAITKTDQFSIHYEWTIRAL